MKKEKVKSIGCFSCCSSTVKVTKKNNQLYEQHTNQSQQIEDGSQNQRTPRLLKKYVNIQSDQQSSEQLNKQQVEAVVLPEEAIAPGQKQNQDQFNDRQHLINNNNNEQNPINFNQNHKIESLEEQKEQNKSQQLQKDEQMSGDITPTIIIQDQNQDQVFPSSQNLQPQKKYFNNKMNSNQKLSEQENPVILNEIQLLIDNPNQNSNQDPVIQNAYSSNDKTKIQEINKQKNNMNEKILSKINTKKNSQSSFKNELNDDNNSKTIINENNVDQNQIQEEKTNQQSQKDISEQNDKKKSINTAIEENKEQFEEIDESEIEFEGEDKPHNRADRLIGRPSSAMYTEKQVNNFENAQQYTMKSITINNRILAETTSENNERYNNFKEAGNNYENISSVSNQYLIESSAGNAQLKRFNQDRIIQSQMSSPFINHKVIGGNGMISPVSGRSLINFTENDNKFSFGSYQPSFLSSIEIGNRYQKGQIQMEIGQIRISLLNFANNQLQKEKISQSSRGFQNAQPVSNSINSHRPLHEQETIEREIRKNSKIGPSSIRQRSDAQSQEKFKVGMQQNIQKVFMLNDIIYSHEAQSQYLNWMRQKQHNDVLGFADKKDDQKKLLININKDESKQNLQKVKPQEYLIQSKNSNPTVTTAAFSYNNQEIMHDLPHIKIIEQFYDQILKDKKIEINRLRKMISGSKIQRYQYARESKFQDQQEQQLLKENEDLRQKIKLIKTQISNSSKDFDDSQEQSNKSKSDSESPKLQKNKKKQ